MKVKQKYLCSKCGATAREYEGLEGGLYIEPSTPPECPKGGDHDFQPIKGPAGKEQTENFMKENLEVKEFSLKKIVENLGKIPKDGGAKFGNDQQKLSPRQKKELMEKVRKFNEYGKVLRCETALMEMSNNLAEIGKMAESYAMTESGDYFQAETVKRDFKEVNGITKQFSQLARECYGGLQQLNALYEDMGRKMERYFEIQSLDEIASAIPQEASSPAPQLGEVSDEVTPQEEEEESISLQEVIKKKINPKVAKDLLKWWNARQAKQAKQSGQKPPTPLKFSKQAQPIKPSKTGKPPKLDKLDKLLAKAKQTSKPLPASQLDKLIQKARKTGPKGGTTGSKVIAPSIFKIQAKGARGRVATKPKPVSIKNLDKPISAPSVPAPPAAPIEPPKPVTPYVPQWKEQPPVVFTHGPEPSSNIPKPSATTTPTSAVPPTPKPEEPPKVTVTPPSETLPDTTPQIIKDYNNTNYVDLNTTKQYEIERNVRDKTITEKNAFKSVDNETYMRLSRYVEVRNKRLEAWRTKLKNEVTSLIEGMPVQKIMLFSSTSQRTNVFIRKGMKLGTVHYGIIDVGRETRWVSKSDFYGEITTFQKSPLKREPDDIRYYVSPQERKPKYERTSEIDTLIARMIGITDKPVIGIFALDKALVKYRFLDKSIFGFKSEEEPFSRIWDPSNPRPLDELKEIMRVMISEKLLLEFVRSSIK